LKLEGIRTGPARKLQAIGWLLAVFGVACGAAEAPVQGWLNQLTCAAQSNPNFQINDLATTPDGHTVAAGSFFGDLKLNGKKLASARGHESDAFLAAFDHLGRAAWIQTIGGPGTDGAAAVSVTANDIFVAGRKTGAETGVGQAGTGPEGQYLFLACYGNDGARKWLKLMPTRGLAANARVAADGAEGVYFSCPIRREIEIGGRQFKPDSSSASLTAKFDGQGRSLWVRKFDARVAGLAPDGARGVLICGLFLERVSLDGVTLVNTSGRHNAFIARLNDRGRVSWAKPIGSRHVSAATAIVSEPAGMIYVSGYGAGIIAAGSAETRIPLIRLRPTQQQRRELAIKPRNLPLSQRLPVVPYTDSENWGLSLSRGFFLGRFDLNGECHWLRSGAFGQSAASRIVNNKDHGPVAIGSARARLQAEDRLLDPGSRNGSFAAHYSPDGDLRWLARVGFGGDTRTGRDARFHITAAAAEDGWVRLAGFCEGAGVVGPFKLNGNSRKVFIVSVPLQSLQPRGKPE
jgi:hypothetical protein